MKQTYTSAATSINARTVPAVFKAVTWQAGTINADVGGGRYDTASEYLDGAGVVNVVIDPYNRPAEHNAAGAAFIADAGGAHTATLSNVLNVIDTAAGRRAVLERARDLLRPGGVLYVTVYEGDGSGVGRRTGPDSWQENRRTASYVDEVRAVFPNVTRYGRIITADVDRRPRSRTAAF